MGDYDPVSTTITTQFNENQIKQTVDTPGQFTRLSILRLQEQATRQALVKLGWTPPGGDAFLEGVKAGLAAAKEAIHYEWESNADEGMSAGIRSAVLTVECIDPATITRKGGADG